MSTDHPMFSDATYDASAAAPSLLHAFGSGPGSLTTIEAQNGAAALLRSNANTAAGEAAGVSNTGTLPPRSKEALAALARLREEAARDVEWLLAFLDAT